MFCSNCGTSIDDNSKFCYSCGFMITQRPTKNGNDENVVRNNYSMDMNISATDSTSHNEMIQCSREDNQIIEHKYDIYGIEYILYQKDQENIDILRTLIDTAKVCRNEVMEYQLQIVGADQLEELEDYISSQFGYFKEKVKSILKKYEIYEVPREKVNDMGRRKVYSEINSIRRQIESELQEAREKKQNAIEYNELKKISRGRIVGGGFGIKGAIKGIATASVINATTGAAYSLKNAFSNMSINADYRRMINSIQGKKYGSKLADVFYNDCLSIIADLFTEFQKVGKKYKYNLGGRNDAYRIYHEISQLFNDDFDEIPKMMNRMLNLFPLETDFFVIVCSRLGDPNGEVLKLATDLELDTSDINKAIASYIYRENLIGSHDDEIFKEIYGDNSIISESFHHFYDYGINYYLEKDAGNAIALYFSNLKYELFAGTNSCYTFEYGKNKNILSKVQDINFTWQEPMMLFWIRSVFTGETYFSDKGSTEYLLLTSENLYSKGYNIPIMRIYKIWCEKKSIIINEKCEIPLYGYDNFYRVIFTGVLLLQLLHQQGKKDSIIPLLTGYDEETLEVTNIYNDVKTRYLDNEGDINEYVANELSKFEGVFMAGYVNEKGIQFIKGRFPIEDDEYFIIGRWSGTSNFGQGFCITNHHLYYANARTGQEGSIELKNFTSNSINIQDNGNWEVLGYSLEGLKKYNDSYFFLHICKNIVNEILDISIQVPIDIIYDNRKMYKSEKEQKDEIFNDLLGKPIEEILKRMIIYTSKRGDLKYDYNCDGLLGSSEPIRWKSFEFEENSDERVYIYHDTPIFQKEQKKGYLITGYGIRSIKSGKKYYITWEELIYAKILWKQSGDLLINDEFCIFSYPGKVIGRLLQYISQITGGPIVVVQRDDYKYQYHGEIVSNLEAFFGKYNLVKKSFKKMESSKILKDELLQENIRIFDDNTYNQLNQNKSNYNSSNFKVIDKTGKCISQQSQNLIGTDERILAEYNSIYEGHTYKLIVTTNSILYEFDDIEKYRGAMQSINMHCTKGRFEITKHVSVTVYMNFPFGNIIFKIRDKKIFVPLPNFSTQECQYIGGSVKLIIEQIQQDNILLGYLQPDEQREEIVFNVKIEESKDRKEISEKKKLCELDLEVEERQADNKKDVSVEKNNSIQEEKNQAVQEIKKITIDDNLEKVIYCPNCKKVIPQGKKFCSQCGTSVLVNTDEKMIMCNICGNSIKQGKKFCSKCGNKI